MTQHEDQSGLAALAAIIKAAIDNGNWITVGESATGDAGSYAAVPGFGLSADSAWLVFTGPAAEGFDYDGKKYDVWPETKAAAVEILTAQAAEAAHQAEAAAMKAVAAITKGE